MPKGSKGKSIQFTVNVTDKILNDEQDVAKVNYEHNFNDPQNDTVDEHNFNDLQNDTVSIVTAPSMLVEASECKLVAQNEEKNDEDSALKLLNKKLLVEIASIREELEAVKSPAKVKNIYKQLFTKKKQLIRAKETIEKLQIEIEKNEKEDNKSSLKASDFHTKIKKLENENQSLKEKLEKSENTTNDLQKDNLMLTDLMKEFDDSIQTGINESEQKNNELCETENIINEFEKDYRELQERYSLLLQETETIKSETESSSMEHLKIEYREKYSQLLEEKELIFKENERKFSSTINEQQQNYSQLLAEIEVIAKENERLNECNQIKTFMKMQEKYDKLDMERKKYCQLELEHGELQEKENKKFKELEEELSNVTRDYTNLYMEMEIISQDNERLNISLTSDHEGDDRNLQHDNKEEDIIRQLQCELKEREEEIQSLCSLARANEDLQEECLELKNKYGRLKESYELTISESNTLKEISARKDDVYNDLQRENADLTAAYHISISDVSTLKSDISWYDLQLTQKKRIIMDQSTELDKTIKELHQLLSFFVESKDLSELTTQQPSRDHEMETQKQTENLVEKSSKPNNNKPAALELTQYEDAERPVDTPTFIKLFLNDSKNVECNENIFHDDEDIGGTASNLIFELQEILVNKDMEITELKGSNGKLEDQYRQLLLQLVEFQKDAQIVQDLEMKYQEEKEEKQLALNEVEKRFEQKQNEKDEELNSIKKRHLEQTNKKQKQFKEMRNEIEEKSCAIDELKEKIEYFKKELKQSLERKEEMKKSASPEKDIQFHVTEARYVKGMKEKDDEIDELENKIKQLINSKQNDQLDLQSAECGKQDLLQNSKLISSLEKKNEGILKVREKEAEILTEKIIEVEKKSCDLKNEVDNLIGLLKEKDEDIIRNVDSQKENEVEIKNQQNNVEELTKKLIMLQNQQRNEKTTIEEELLMMTRQVEKLINVQKEVDSYKERVSELEEDLRSLNTRLVVDKNRNKSEIKYLQLTLENRTEELENAQKANSEKDKVIKKSKKTVIDWEDKYLTQKSTHNRVSNENEELKNDFTSLKQKYDILKSEKLEKRAPIRESKIIVKENRLVSFNDDVVTKRYSFVDIEGSEIDYTKLFNEISSQQGQQLPVSLLCQTSESTQTSDSLQPEIPIQPVENSKTTEISLTSEVGKTTAQIQTEDLATTTEAVLMIPLTQRSTLNTVEEEVVIAESIYAAMSENEMKFECTPSTEAEEDNNGDTRTVVTKVETGYISINTVNEEGECKTMGGIDERISNQLDILAKPSTDIKLQQRSTSQLRKTVDELNNKSKERMASLDRIIAKYKAENIKLISDYKKLKEENETKQWQLKAKDVLLSNTEEIIDDLEKQSNSAMDLTEEVHKQKIEIELANKEAQEYNENIQKIKILLKEEEETNSQLEQVIAKLEKEIENHQSQMKEKDQLLENERNIVINLKKREEKIQEKEKENVHLHETITELEKKISEQRKREASGLQLKSANFQLEQEVNMLQSQLKFASSVDERAKEISSSIIKELEEKIKSKDNELDKLRTEIKQVDAEELYMVLESSAMEPENLQLEQQYVIIDEKDEHLVSDKEEVVNIGSIKDDIGVDKIDHSSHNKLKEESVMTCCDMKTLKYVAVKLKEYKKLMLALKKQKSIGDTSKDEIDEVEQLNGASKQTDENSYPQDCNKTVFTVSEIMEQINNHLQDVVNISNELELSNETSLLLDNNFVEIDRQKTEDETNNNHDRVNRIQFQSKSQELKNANKLISILKSEKDALCKSVTMAQQTNDKMTLELLEFQNTDLVGDLNDVTNSKTEHDIAILVRDLEIRRLRTLLANKYFKKGNLLLRKRRPVSQMKMKKKPEILFENSYDDKHNSIVFSYPK